MNPRESTCQACGKDFTGGYFKHAIKDHPRNLPSDLGCLIFRLGSWLARVGAGRFPVAPSRDYSQHCPECEACPEDHAYWCPRETGA